MITLTVQSMTLHASWVIPKRSKLRMRTITEMMALTLQGALLVQYAPMRQLHRLFVCRVWVRATAVLLAPYPKSATFSALISPGGAGEPAPKDTPVVVPGNCPAAPISVLTR